MPLCSFVIPYDKFHGRILDAFGGSGQVAFSSAKSANVSRKYVIPENPESTNQSAIRGYMTTAAAGFQALSDTVAGQWTAAANTINRTNILGLSYELSGIALYCMVNVYRLMAGESLTSTVPSIVPPTQPAGTQAIMWDSGSSEISVALTDTGLTDTDMCLIRISRALGGQARKARKNDCRLVSQTISDHFTAISSEDGSITVDADNFTISATDYCGLLITPLNADYFPGPAKLITNHDVSAI